MATDTTTMRLWEVKHPYYCSESNYYVGGTPRPYPNGQPKPAILTDDFVPYDHVRFDSWADFGWKDSDPDMNLLFRWDWYVPDPDDYEDEELPEERLNLFFMLQRKGRFMVISFPVRRDEEPEIRTWLKERLQTIKALWAPLI